jgi:UDP-glucuronate decarboxylase
MSLRTPTFILEVRYRCGDGSQTRSFCYVDDLVDALIRLTGTADDVTGPVNIGNPSEFTIRELAETVIGLTGSSWRLVYLPLPVDDPGQRRPDVSKVEKLIGWSPKIGLREGLTKAIEYFKRTAVSGATQV